MKTSQPPKAWEHFSTDLEDQARARGFTTHRGIYGLTVFGRGVDAKDKWWVAPTGHYMNWFYDPDKDQVATHHGHGSEAVIRARLTEWMDLRS